MEKFSTMKYKTVFDEKIRRWCYEIYSANEDLISDSPDFFDSQGEARYAAIGHISVLEKTLSNSELPRS